MGIWHLPLRVCGEGFLGRQHPNRTICKSGFLLFITDQTPLAGHGSSRIRSRHHMTIEDCWGWIIWRILCKPRRWCLSTDTQPLTDRWVHTLNESESLDRKVSSNIIKEHHLRSPNIYCPMHVRLQTQAGVQGLPDNHAAGTHHQPDSTASKESR